MSGRFIDSPELFGLGIGTTTHGEFRCALCGTVHNEGVVDEDEDYDNGVFNTVFAGINVGECCFARIENEILRRMPEILSWYNAILKARGEKLKSDTALINAIINSATL